MTDEEFEECEQAEREKHDEKVRELEAQPRKTEKQIRLCLRIMHRLIRRWYEEQGITRDNCPYDGIKQYGSAVFGYRTAPVCNLTLHTTNDKFLEWNEYKNVQ